MLPLVEPIADLLYAAVDHGCEAANDLLPYHRDPWYWSHTARFHIKDFLHPRIAEVPSWELRPNVPNCGIHFSLAGLHPVRLVRSLSQDAPPPGRNRSRRDAWTNAPQLDLTLGEPEIPLVSLLLDWHLDGNGEPVIHVSIPRGPWAYGSPVRLHWREVLQRPSAASVLSLRFAGDDGGDPLLLLVDQSEATAT